MVPMEVENFESNEDEDNITAMEVDKDQNQPPSNQTSCRSTRVSQPPTDLSPRLHDVSHKLSEHPSFTTTTRTSCGLMGGGGHVKEWKNTSPGHLTTKHCQLHLHEVCK